MTSQAISDTEQPELLLTIDEVAALLRLKRTAARDALAADGAPRAIRLNARCVRYFHSDVVEWLRTRQQSGRPALELVKAAPVARVGRPRKNVL